MTESLLECPCCGGDGAESVDGEFHDGQALICGCPGWVSIDPDDGPWINNGDARCQKCEEPTPPSVLVERTPGETS